MKKLTLILGLVLLSFFMSYNSDVLAQGVATCLWTGTSCTKDFVPACEEQASPPSDWEDQCDTFTTQSDCLSAQIPCVYTECGDLGDVCCGDGPCTCNSPYVPSADLSLNCDICTCIEEECGDLGEVCCGDSPCTCNSLYVPSDKWSLNCDICMCNDYEGSCGGLYQKCCGEIPPLWCDSGFIPSDYDDVFYCQCLDGSDLIQPPDGSNCISFPIDIPKCPDWASIPCLGDNYVWCCPSSMDCQDAIDELPEPPTVPPTIPPQEVFCVGTDPDIRTDNPLSGKIATAIGCVPVNDMGGFIIFILPWAIGIVGGIAFILIIYAGIMIIASSGDPKRIQAGKELLTAAIAGVALLIFGTFILEFIGVDILNIPGFGN